MKHLADPVTRTAVLSRLASLRQDSPRRWGKMTVHQGVCHLSDSFKMPLGEKHADRASGFLERTLIKTVALYVPLPWPHGVPTRPQIDQMIGGTSPSTFNRDRQELAALTERFCGSAAKLNDVFHPIFGPLTSAQWMRWGYLHFDHHLRQFGA